MPVLAYFDPKADHIIQVDGSMNGLDAVLLYKVRPVIYASRTLEPVEPGYSTLRGSSSV